MSPDLPMATLPTGRPGPGEPVPAVLFDLDGTILDPGGAITEGVAEAIEAHGYPRPEESVLRSFVGPPTSVSLERHTDIPAEDRRSILAQYRAGYPERARKDSTVYPGMRELLEALREAPVLVGLATQKPQHSTERILRDFRLEDCFDAVSGARDELDPATLHLPADKPGIVARALRLLAEGGSGSPDAQRSLMIGDREYDVQGAAAAHLPCAGVLWGFGEPEELQTAGARWLVADAADLRRVVAERTGVGLPAA